MYTLLWIGIGLVSFVGLMILGLTLFALSATFSLPLGPG
jgi:hypothetical protein